MEKEKSLKIMQVWTKALEGISQDARPTIKSSFFLFFSLVSLQFALTYGPLILLPKPIDDSFLIGQRVFEAFWGIALSILYSMVVPYYVYKNRGQHNLSLSEYIKKHIKYVLVETLRTLPVIALYALLLIIPGLVKIIRLIFVSWVVQLYRPYGEGKVDALKTSAKLTEGSFAGIASFYFLSQIGIVFIVMWLPSYLRESLALEAGSFQNLLLDFMFNVPISIVFEVSITVGLLKVFESMVVIKGEADELAF